MQNTEQTVPSTQKNNFLFENIVIQLNSKQLRVNIYDTPLGKRWLEALQDNLVKKRVLEKNYCFLGWADSKRNIFYLCDELNKNIATINSFEFNPAYPKLQRFVPEQFQNPYTYQLRHEACNVLHRYFEDLQGQAWELSDYYKQAPNEVKYSIRQLNNLCHEIESWVNANKKKNKDPEWMRPSQITTFLNAPRHELHDEDFELFKQNRYDRELGGVYLHWSQVGKTLFEVWRDHDEAVGEGGINHQKYYSGEFDIEWGQTITEEDKFKKEEMDEYREWLKEKGFDWNDTKLALGYIKVGQIDMKLAFQDKPFLEVYEEMKDNLNIKSIHIIGSRSYENEYPYTLESNDWKQIQMEGLRAGYESYSMR